MAPERPEAADAIPATMARVEPNAAHPDQALYAALDLGTNSCRMLIAQPRGSHFQVADSFSKTVTLALGLTDAGPLSRASIGRTVQAPRLIPMKVEKPRTEDVSRLAAEARRRAVN